MGDLGVRKTIVVGLAWRPLEDKSEVHHRMPRHGESQPGLSFTGPFQTAITRAQVSRIAVRAPNQD